MGEEKEGKRGGEKKKEIDGENELEPVRFDPELGVPRVSLCLTVLAGGGTVIEGEGMKGRSNEVLSPGQPATNPEMGVTSLRQVKVDLQCGNPSVSASPVWDYRSVTMFSVTVCLTLHETTGCIYFSLCTHSGLSSKATSSRKPFWVESLFPIN